MLESERMRISAMESDADLLALVLQGDRQAYGRLYDRYAPFIRAICYDTTRELSQANDLCQEVFLCVSKVERVEAARKNRGVAGGDCEIRLPGMASRSGARSASVCGAIAAR